jgi:hypothetical protein
MEETQERCKNSSVTCYHCRAQNQCPIRNKMIDIISAQQVAEGGLKKAQGEISSLQGRISSLLNDNSSLKEKVHKLETIIGTKRMKDIMKREEKLKKKEGEPEQDKKEEVPIGAITEQEPEVQELISAAATASEELGDDECEKGTEQPKREPNVMTPENHLFEIKCPKCGGFWHDPENNVGREEICKKCKGEVEESVQQAEESGTGK